jgi:hypothetical protein
VKLALRYLLVVAIFQLATGWAQACLFTRNVQPERWYDWASALFSGEVTKVEQDRRKSLDIITVRVVETFKGPAGDIATVQIPTRLRTACGLDLPAVGAQVLVALDPGNDSAWVPLKASYAELLREYKSKLQPSEKRPGTTH